MMMLRVPVSLLLKVRLTIVVNVLMQLKFVNVLLMLLLINLVIVFVVN